MNGVPDYEYNNVKIGIRNKKYSVTLEGLFTQTFESLIMRGLYNLIEDVDETKSIKEENFQIQDLLGEAKKEWINLTKKTIDDDTLYDFKIKYHDLIMDNYFLNAHKAEKKQFRDYVQDASVIIFGRGNLAETFINEYGNLINIKMVWDNYAIDKYWRGYCLEKPNAITYSEEDVIVICSRYEYDILKVLRELGVSESKIFMASQII